MFQYSHCVNVSYLFGSVDAELKNCGMIMRKPSTPLKPFLLDARQTGYPLEGARLDLIEQFANCYEHARHDPAVSIMPLVSLRLYLYYFKCDMPVVNYCPLWPTKSLRIVPALFPGCRLQKMTKRGFNFLC